MKSHRLVEKVKRITWCLLLLVSLTVLAGCEPTGFQVSKVSLRPPDWAPSEDCDDVVTVAISFNRAVDPDSLKDTVKVGLKGLHDGRTAPNIAGFVHVSADSKVAVFCSYDSLTILIHPLAGENIEYTITVIRTDVVAAAVADTAGEFLDGDKDGQPGGDYREVIEVVG